jgi:hypothetical protein
MAWLQNIHSKDLMRKISEINNLQERQVFMSSANAKGRAECKGLRWAQPSQFNLLIPFYGVGTN